MPGVLDFFTKEAGQKRRKWLDETNNTLEETIRHYAGPGFSDAILGTASLAPELTPAADFRDMVAASGETAEAVGQGDPVGAARGGLGMLASLGMAVLPGSMGAAKTVLGESAKAVPAPELRAAARSGADVAPVFRGVANNPPAREAFHADMLRGKAAQGPYGAAVDVRETPEAYTGERMFGTREGSRFSVSPSGEINSVVRQQDEPNKALATEALTTAKRHGGRWLSVFDTQIAEKYARAGFRPVKRMKFADEYAPEGWDYDKFSQYNAGRPDVVFMEYDPSYKGEYSAGDTNVGEYTDDYDAATTELTVRAAAAEDPLVLGKRVLGKRAEHLEVPVKDRPKAVPELLQMSTTPEGYTRSLPAQAEVATPRLPEGAKYPQNDRIRPLIERQDELAELLAKRMEPHKGGPAQYFYHSGPVVEAAERAGMDPEEARAAFNQFADYYAATSPRTQTEQNLRNAALARWKAEQGVPLTETVGPGGATATGEPLMGEKGYPMMLGESGIHALRLGELGTGGPNMLTNPKPYTFAENIKGNLEGVTADTHAIRGALSALNEIEPGAVPDEWILPKHREAYRKDPSSFDPATWVDDKLKTVSHKGQKLQPEYGAISDLYRKVLQRRRA